MDITINLVRRLVAAQFPRWAGLSVRSVPRQGNDNRTFRLGEELSCRLPSAAGYVAGVSKEDAALPLLAGHLAVAVPEPLAVGEPGEGYPFPWSVRRWLVGTTPDQDPALDRTGLARDVGAFLRDLRRVPVVGGPPAGPHSFHRGSHPSVYADQVDVALAELGDRVDRAGCRSIWDAAVATTWAGPPVWFHGDVAVGNLLTTDGTLIAVIDWGTCGVGDPACDLVLAWTLLGPGEREVFADAVDLDDHTWARARGWALWKSLITLPNPASAEHDVQRRAYAELLGHPFG
ncbi:MAG: aminoglycoside phosphotransferase family protein [Nocardioides sp.]